MQKISLTPCGASPTGQGEQGRRLGTTTFDDYVGNYRTVMDGKLLGDITVTRKGDKLFEAWGKENPEELLPGGHDTFFVRGDGLVEQFLRDEHNRVTGIHYIFSDDHFEAKRVDESHIEKD